MESVLVSRISLDELSLTPSQGCSEFVLKAYSGSCVYWTAYPFSEIFLMVFPWNSVDVVLYNGVEECGQAHFDPDTKETKQGVIQINKGNVTGTVKIQVNFSALPDFKQQNGTNKDLFVQYKESLKDVKVLIHELIEGSLNNDLENLNKEKIMRIDLQTLNKDELNTESEIREILIGISEKLKVLTGVEVILQETQKMNQSSLKAREDLFDFIQNKVKTDENRQKDVDRVLNQYQAEVTKVKSALNHSQESNRAKDAEILQLSNRILELESEKSSLLSQVKNFDAQEQFIRNLQTEIKTLEQERNDLRSEFVQAEEHYSNLTQEKDLEFSKISLKNLELETFITQQQSQIFTLESQLSAHQSTILSQSSELQALASELKCLHDQEQKALTLENLSKKHQAECMKTQENMQKTTSKFSELIKNLNQEKLKLLKTISDLQGQISLNTERIKVLDEKLLSENAKNLELKSKNSSLQETINQSVDSQHISKSLLRLYSEYSRSKSQFTSDAGLFIKVFQDQAHSLLTTNRYLLELQRLLTKKDEEILIFCDIITELQRRIPYFPVKDDEVDIAMADYINSLQDPLEIPFVREDSGIYLFGTKKVFVKLDNGKLSIRIGGGALLLDEYIESYTGNELAKLNDRRRRKSREKKNLMGKVLEKISNLYEAGDKIKNSEISAQKAAKVIIDVTGKNRSLTMRRSSSRVGSESLSPAKKLNRMTTAMDRNC